MARTEGIRETLEVLRQRRASGQEPMHMAGSLASQHFAGLHEAQRCPYRSQLGERITYEWLGVATLDQVSLIQVPSTFRVDGDVLARVDDQWNAAIERGEKRFDGAQIRFEGCSYEGDRLKLGIGGSPISYRLHNIMRDPSFWESLGMPVPKDRMGFPNPFTIV